MLLRRMLAVVALLLVLAPPAVATLDVPGRTATPSQATSTTTTAPPPTPEEEGRDLRWVLGVAAVCGGLGAAAAVLVTRRRS